MGLNHLQSLICTYSADDLRPLVQMIQFYIVLSLMDSLNNTSKHYLAYFLS